MLSYLGSFTFAFRDWIIHRWTPFVRHFPDNHTGVNIKLNIDDMISRLRLDTLKIDKYVVNDNASNAVCAIKLSPDLTQILCANHTLNLAVEDTFKDVSVGVTTMKDVLAKGKVLSNAVKRSGPLMQEFKNACKEVGIAYTTMKNPNDTRWNSEVTNLSSILKVEKALIWLVNQDETGQWSSKVFSPTEWRLAKAAVKVLQVPLLVTKVWEAEKNPTMNLVISEVYGMRERLEGIRLTAIRSTSYRWAGQ